MEQATGAILQSLFLTLQALSVVSGYHYPGDGEVMGTVGAPASIRKHGPTTSPRHPAGYSLVSPHHLVRLRSAAAARLGTTRATRSKPPSRLLQPRSSGNDNGTDGVYDDSDLGRDLSPDFVVEDGGREEVRGLGKVENASNGSSSSISPSNVTEIQAWPTYVGVYVTILNLLIFFVGTMGNLLVIVVVIVNRDMRTPMNWYLVNLSLADLLVLLVCQPAALTEFFARDRWLLGAALCPLVPFLEHSVWHSSTLIIIAITVERYYAICKPLRKLSICHRPHPLRVLPCVWVLAMLAAVPFVVMTSLVDTLFYDGTPCQVCSTNVKPQWRKFYVMGNFVFFFVLPMLLLLCLYIKIIHALKTSGSTLHVRQAEDVSHVSTRRSRKQVIKMLAAVVVIFFVTLLPLRCVIVWQINTPDHVIQGLGAERYFNLMWACRLMMYANSAGNPIIYSLLSSNFQAAFWRLLTAGRHYGRGFTPRSSVLSRHTSVTRWSASALQQYTSTLSSPARWGSTRGSMRGSGADPPPNRNGLTHGRPGPGIALRRIRTSSSGSWGPDSPLPSPLIQNGEAKDTPGPAAIML